MDGFNGRRPPHNPGSNGSAGRSVAGGRHVAGGVLKPGDEIVVLPSGLHTTIARITTLDGEIDEAFPPMSVVVHLTDDVDVSRGDMFARPGNQPTTGQDLDAMVCWMAERPRATSPIHHDPYTRNRTTGSLILIDEASNATVGAGMLLGDR
jgi:bifunctional enzyme CysN/CysC/sulfate adenylyltransferase subunit 1